MYEITRREFILSSAAAAAVFGLNGRLALIGTAHAQKSMEQGFYRYKVGAIEVTALYDGIWERPLDPAFIKNATVDETKAALAAAGLTTEFVPIPFTPNVVKTGGKLVLIDSGTGGGQTGGPKAGTMMKHLAAAGIDAGAVDIILISHFHPDHIYGLMTKAPENKAVFPNAEIYLPAAEYKYWMDPAIEKLPEGRRPLAKRIQEIFPLMKDKVHQFDGGKELAPGIRPIDAHGHTPGHTAFHISSGKDQFIVLGDTANIPALFVRNPGWHAAFDQDAVMAEATRRKLFDRVVADKLMVTGYHFPFPAVGTIVKDGKGYAFKPV